ncbi:MAG: 16S rRNA (uracil(1498)-N(3))-methyltransferase [Cyanobacteriota bacterium]|nr:16S rRNA (uracil(1498)-N(3))-methyltransferase [Cyanobacteriota bacterium]
MAREARRLLITPERLAQAAPLVPLHREEHHYLQRVLRLRVGDRFAVVDGAGRLWPAAVEPEGARLLLPVDQPAEAVPPPQPRLQLAVALPRQGSDVLLRMVCELGIDRIQPLLAERSVQERWNPQRAAAIVREALEQCERLWLPELGQPEAAVPWFEACTGVQLLAATRRGESLSLAAALATLPAAAGAVTVAIGPEGGWSETEEARALASGWQPVSLGSTILRTSTAAVAAAAALGSWRA